MLNNLPLYTAIALIGAMPAQAAQLGLPAIERYDESIHYDISDFDEAIEIPVEEYSTSNCNELSHLGPNLIAQASGPIIEDDCAFDLPVKDTSSGFNPAYLAIPAAGLGAALPFILDGPDNPPNVPEPKAIPFLFAILGLGGIVLRKKLKRDH